MESKSRLEGRLTVLTASRALIVKFFTKCLHGKKGLAKMNPK